MQGGHLWTKGVLEHVLEHACEGIIYKTQCKGGHLIVNPHGPNPGV